jgi:hypothetical protein
LTHLLFSTGSLHGDCQVWEVSNLSFVSQPGRWGGNMVKPGEVDIPQ